MTLYHTLHDKVMTGPTCVALGMFDGLHLGHQAVLNAVADRAREEALCAAVFTFSTLHNRPKSKLTSARLLTPRLWEQLLDAMHMDCALCLDFDEFRELSPEQFVREILAEKLQTKFVACGSNFRFGKQASASATDLRELAKPYGIEVFIAPLVEVGGTPVSTTRIRGRIVAGDIPAANGLLGRRFAIDFEVVHGRQLGRTIDSPTINQPLPPYFVVPRFGVYATVATVEGERYAAVTNVGVKPTVGSDTILAETYILGYSGDLYGQHILVEFLEFIRGEERYASVQELREHIQQDCAVAKAIAGKILA